MRGSLVKFEVVRFILELPEMVIYPYIISHMINWLQSSDEESLRDSISMVAFGMLIPAIKIVRHTSWEFLCFQMIEVGHRVHSALKVMLYRKSFRMTLSTNKEYSSGEIYRVVMIESRRF